jgi:hypothetical protein
MSKLNNKRIKPLPRFRSEVKEREFWESKGVDVAEYFDTSKMVVAKFNNLRPTNWMCQFQKNKLTP